MNSSNTDMTADLLRLQSVGVARLLVAVIAGVALCVGLSSTAYADEEPEEESADPSPPDCSDCYRVDAIVIDGLLRTRRYVVERELLFEEGDIATVAEVEESVQRLRNTGIFRRVEWEFDDQTIGTYDGTEVDAGLDGGALRLIVDERYTVSPSFRFGQGGDTLRLLLGLQDVNLGGTFLQGGATYSRLGDANSFSLWFRDPRFLNARQEVTIRGSLNNQLYTLYDNDRNLQGGFFRTERQASLSLGREWTRWFRSGVHSSFSADSFSYNMVDEDRRLALEENEGLYDPIQTVTVGITSQLGRINRQQHQLSGYTLRLRLEQNFHFGDLHRRSERIRAAMRSFTELPFDATFAMRARIGFRTAEPSYMQFFAGGLDVLRGTVNNRYRGPNYWYGNVELRVPAYRNNWVILEPVGFLDAVRVAEIPRDVLGLTATTTGMGLRIISRDFHGVIVRIDYAPPILGADGPGLSFGAGQFF